MVNVSNQMYAKLPNLVLGFHGCHKDVFESVIKNGQHLKRSENDYDWLGNGIYFWENSYERAYDWAKARYSDDASVVGAVIDLGYCLNLTDYNSSPVLRLGYNLLKLYHDSNGSSMPVNRNGRSKTDLLLRNLDCAVIEQIHKYYREKNFEPYDSIRGIFTEGKEVYPGSGFVEKTHTQLCIVNPNCIKAFIKQSEDTVVLLSKEEAETLLDQDEISEICGESWWWLRTPYPGHSSDVYLVLCVGSLCVYCVGLVGREGGIVPALELYCEKKGQ